MSPNRVYGFALAAALTIACGSATNGTAAPEADITGSYKDAGPNRDAAATPVGTTDGGGAPIAAVSEVIRGKLTKGQLTPFSIVELQGTEDTNVVDVDIRKTKFAGSEAMLLKAPFAGQEFWIRGQSTQRDTGKMVGGSKVSIEVLVAERVATVAQDKATGDGILRKEADGTFTIEIKVGTGPDADDAGSFAVDLSAIKSSFSALIGKKVHVEGLKLNEIVGVVANSVASSELMIADSVRAAN